MEPDRARGVRQRVGARQPVQQRLPPRGRATRTASSRGRCGPVRERRRASNRRVSGGAHGSARRLLVELPGVLKRDRFPRVGSVSSTRRGCFTARVRRVRRRIDDVSIVQRCVSNLSRGTGGLARSVGEEMMFGRGSGLHFSLESCGRRLHAIVARGTYGNQDGAAFRNSQINSDRGDPPFLIWREV